MVCQPLRNQAVTAVLLFPLLLMLNACASNVPKPTATPYPADASRSKSSSKSCALRKGTYTQSCPYQIDNKWYYPLASHEGYRETGNASWYGDAFHGRKTASGEPYNQYDLTAAHKTLPLGCKVKVTDVRTGRSVILRVNDRGPFVDGRIIDLSYAAASQLGILDQGVARVRVEALSGPPVPDTVVAAATVPDLPEQVATVQKPEADSWPLQGSVLTIQVGAFLKKDNAEKVRRRLGTFDDNVAVESGPWPNGPYFTVRVGRFDDARVAETKLNELKDAGFKDAFFVFLEE